MISPLLRESPSSLYCSRFVHFLPHLTGVQIISCGEMSPTCSICICPLQYLAVRQDFSPQKDKPFHFPTFSICLSPGTSSHFRRSPKRRSSTVRARRLCFTFSFCLNHLTCFPNSKNQQNPFYQKIHVENLS